jgi:hypothetical protein
VIIAPENGLLLFHNHRWGGYAFPMKKLHRSDQPDDAALAAIDDDIQLVFPNATAGPPTVTHAYGLSGGMGVDTYYRYHVFQIDPGPIREGLVHTGRVKFFPFPVLCAADNVTWSTKAIARAIAFAYDHQLTAEQLGEGR